MTTYEIEASNSLQTLHIPPHFKGYRLLGTALSVINENPQLIHKLPQLYAEVAAIHKTSPRTIGSAINHALQSAKSDFTVQQEVLGTNRELRVQEFMATLHRSIEIRVADKEIGCLR